MGTKYCKHCGEIIDIDCVICPKCGKQVEKISAEQPNVVINNANTNINGTNLKNSKQINVPILAQL